MGQAKLRGSRDDRVAIALVRDAELKKEQLLAKERSEQAEKEADPAAYQKKQDRLSRARQLLAAGAMIAMGTLGSK